ncbi:MAG TPA: GTPase Era [Candidatus Binataceae bacterium]|nr:GTPase Era [Candidatus Binataceae bacterium]
MSTASIENPHKAGFVAIGGRTNVGKSSLLNRIVGQKVAIVTPKPQTTRRRILGIRSDPDAQIILIDAPGLHESRRPLNRRMVETARRSLEEGEVILAVVEAGAALKPEDAAFLAEAAALGRPTAVAINKIDKCTREGLMQTIGQAHDAIPAAEIVPVSARTGENLEELIRVLKQLLPASPPLMSPEEYTDQTERMIAEEIVREKLFLAMGQEIPFSTAVMTERFIEEGGLTRISALIVVERESHKGMVIGAGGRKLKEIGTNARLELEQILARRVFLELHVKVERGWTADPRKLREMGL